MTIPISNTFLGEPILTAPPQGAIERGRQLLQPLDEFAADSGALFATTDLADLAGHYDFEWLFTTRAETKAFQAFFDARKGRYDPFYFPVWQFPFDIVPLGANDVSPGSQRVWFTPQSYGTRVFSLGTVYRKFLFVRGPFYRVIRASAVGSDATGEWVRDDANSIGDGYNTVLGTHPNGYSSVDHRVFMSYVLWGRFASDMLEIEYLTNEIAQVRATILHLPDETP